MPSSVSIAPAQYILVHFDSEIIPSMTRFGLTHKAETACWMRSGLKVDALTELMGISDEPQPDAGGEWHEITLKTNGQYASLAELFHGLLEDLVKQIEDRALRITCRSYLLIDFLAFNVPTPKIDRVIEGLALQSESKKLFDFFTQTVVLARSATMFHNSREFSRPASSTSVAVFDLVGVGFASGAENGTLNRISSPRRIFRDFLNISEKGIRQSLIRETNTFIGNFELPNSRVRTHYDLDQFARRDEFLDHVYWRIAAMADGWETVLIIGTGFERNALAAVAHHYTASRTILSGADYYELDDPSFRETVLPDWSSIYDGVLVLADIVNSGDTLGRALQELTRSNSARKPVKAFAMMLMENSPTQLNGVHIEHALRLQRTFYHLDDKACPLEIYGQPSQKVQKLEDFRTVHDAQPTPFDFWEMVGECDGLQWNGSASSHPQSALRIDVVKVLKKYTGWLKNIVRTRWDKEFGQSSVTTILTVNETGGIAFAKLVQQAFSPRPLNVIHVSRSDLEKVMPTHVPEAIKAQFSDQDSNVLIVDDGVNEGTTMRGLIAICKGMRKIPIGAMVLTSRLTYEKANGLETLMGTGRFMPLYAWPAHS